jgi:aspartate aminotransferase/aminotransferase
VGEVLITSGVSGGLLLAILSIIDPGDEAVFLDPYFVMYKHLLTVAGGKSVLVDSYPDFRFHADRVEKAITPRTKMLMLNSPSNPTGVVMSEAEIRAAVDLARKHDLLLLSDEIYEPFLYEKEGNATRVTGVSPVLEALSTGETPVSHFVSPVIPHPSLYSPAAIYEKTILLRGFSKSHAMTGWRIGYAAGPAEIISQMTKLQQYTFVCAPSPLQYAALKALDVPMNDAVNAYRRKRDLVFDKLSREFEIVKPSGAFYIFPQAPKGASATDFVTEAIKNNVLIIPGNVFSERDTHFRISYATTDEELVKGCEILCSLV